MKIKATIVSENCVFHLAGAVAEHGLSIFMETDCGNYLLDTGQGKAIVNNALVLGIDLRTIKGIILSHHHWGHTGGLDPVLDLKGATFKFSKEVRQIEPGVWLTGEIPRRTDYVKSVTRHRL
ncbi:MAG: MBL fold metallo-hydrolase [Syntrophales bacterium]